MADENEYLTQEKFNQLKVELEELKTVARKEVAENLEYAKSLGDLSENAEYHEARERQANVEDRINKIEAILKTAVIVSAHHSEAVGVGSTVKVEKEADQKTSTYYVVGGEEADASQNKISIHSPLGEAMLGKKKGDRFEAKTPKGTVVYRVVSIA